MTSLRKVLGGRLVLGVAFLACACQHDSVASFDDTLLPTPSTGGTTGAAGSLAIAGDTADGGDDTSGAGTSSEAGSAAVAGTGGSAMGGAESVAGTSSGGSAGKPGTAGEGGSAGTGGGGSAGTGGKEPDPEPEPVTITIQDFADTYVASCMNLNFGEAETLNVDSGNGCVYQALVNPSLADVPEGALVSAATLTLSCVNVGDAVSVAYVAEPWKEDTVRWNTRPGSGEDLAELTCKELGAVTLDVTAAVKAWTTGKLAPHGLRLSTEGEDGTDFASSESEDADQRPSLSVTYELPVK